MAISTAKNRFPYPEVIYLTINFFYNFEGASCQNVFELKSYAHKALYRLPLNKHGTDFSDGQKCLGEVQFNLKYV